MYGSFHARTTGFRCLVLRVLGLTCLRGANGSVSTTPDTTRAAAVESPAEQLRCAEEAIAMLRDRMAPEAESSRCGEAVCAGMEAGGREDRGVAVLRLNHQVSSFE